MLIARDLIENCTSFNKKMRIEMLEKFPLPFLSFEEEILPFLGTPSTLLLLDDLQGVCGGIRLIDANIKLGRTFLQLARIHEGTISDTLYSWINSAIGFCTFDVTELEYITLKERSTLEDPEEICLYNAVLSVLRGRPGNAYIMLLLREHITEQAGGYATLRELFDNEISDWYSGLGRVI
jgi:hypothetical protein